MSPRSTSPSRMVMRLCLALVPRAPRVRINHARPAPGWSGGPVHRDTQRGCPGPGHTPRSASDASPRDSATPLTRRRGRGVRGPARCRRGSSPGRQRGRGTGPGVSCRSRCSRGGRAVLDRVGERLAEDPELPGVQAVGRACGPAVGQRPQRGLGDLRDGEPVVMHVDERLGRIHHPVMPIASTAS